MQIAVGGCLAQKDRGEIVRRAPWVDVVFGTHNIGSLPVLLERARHNAGRRGGDPRVARGLPVDAADPARVDVRRLGVDLGRAATTPARSASCRRCAAGRRTADPGDILAEVRALVAEGVLEVTLLGQNVNSYGVEFGDRHAFGKLLRACGERRRAWSGSGSPARTRRTSPTTSSPRWPRRRTCATRCTCRCSPGRTRCCGRCAARTGRDATSASSTRYARRCRTRRSPPTSSSASPARPRTTSSPPWTLSRAARFSSAPSPSSTPSAPARRRPRWTVRCRRRSSRSATSGWSACVEEISWAENQRSGRLDGRGAGRRRRGPQGQRHRPDVRPGAGRPPGPLRRHVRRARSIRPGDIVHATVTYAAPHHLNADGPLVSHRRTRAGDAWEAGPRPATDRRPARPAHPPHHLITGSGYPGR